MRIVLTAALSFAVYFSVLNTGLSQDDSDKGFVLVREDDDIFIYERWIIFPKSNPPVKAREVKGEFTVRSTVSEAFALLQDEKKIQLWQKHVSEFKVYLQRDTTQWLEYSYHDIPWPVSDQDHFLEYTIGEDSTPGRLFITFETKINPTLAPVREDVSRMALAGSWLLEDKGNQKVKVTYRILSMPSSIPRFFTDPVIRSNLMSTIKDYIQVLEKK